MDKFAMASGIPFIILEAMIIYFLVLWAHSLRHRFGQVFFYALIGALTAVMSWVTDVGLAIEVGSIKFVIGSTVFYTSLLLSVFVVYVFDGPQMTRIAISTILLVSIFVPLLAASLHLQANALGVSSLTQIPVPDLRINAASAITTCIDLIFLAVVWEFFGKPTLNLKLWLRSYATLLGVMWLDVALFATGAFAGTPDYVHILKGTLLSRFLITLLAFPFLYVYLCWQSRISGQKIENRPVLAILKRVAEAENELSIAKREIKKRKVAEAALAKSEALLEATGTMARVGGWELMAESQEVYWTNETYRIHEVPEGKKIFLDEALGFYPLDERQKLRQAIDSAFEKGLPYDLELRFSTATGKELWVHSIGQPVLEKGKTVKLIGSFQDISTIKQAELSLQQYQEELEAQIQERTSQLSQAKNDWETTFDSVSDWMSIIDVHHTILRSNKASESIVKLPPQDVIGKSCFKLVHAADCPVVDCPAERAFASKQREEMVFLAEDGRWLEVIVDPISSDPQENEKIVHIVKDITALKKKEEEIISARKSEAFHVLAGGIAHDYNNLLAVIWGNISLLKDEFGDASQREFLEDAEHACELAKTLTHQFLTLSENMYLRKSTWDLKDILQAALDEVSLSTRIESSLDLPKTPTTLDVAREQMQIAFRNIIMNAAESMPSGGRLKIQTFPG